ncbi:calpain-like cysteine peptidase [Novymonas esmeraldas]|uniref:Calpain-like cysteine peptidase n=1 Tax=Novymonas esmeraldas TaxID=1808958 RepID=A0AAW0F683_9TRYP
MVATAIQEMPDSGKVFVDHEFHKRNATIAEEWQHIGEVYPAGASQPLLPETFSRDQFAQGNHYECFMISALATLVRFPDVIRRCFVTKKVRQDGRYTFQFFRGQQWVKVEIDDRIAMEDGEVLYTQSPTEHWWPLLLEKAYAKFYTAYDHLDGCTLQETFHDLTGNPVLNIPMDAKLAKAASCNVLEGRYWLDLAQRIQSGEFVAAALTKDVEVETMGLQREQQYGILDIFSLHGTSGLDDIVVHLHNPFEDEEYLYKGPLNRTDTAWSDKQRAKHDVDNPRSIFLPLNIFLKIVNSMQLCYVHTVSSAATYFEDEWKGESAGGNPTFVSWRKNPLYYISNHGTEAVTLSFVVKQDDQRHRRSSDEETTYKQCGMILAQYSYLCPIPTFWVTGNNHKPIHKSLFLNSREVANSVTVPPQSLCYLVPSCMRAGEEAKFLLSAHRLAHQDYRNITMKRLSVPDMDWEHPVTGAVELQMRTKDRIDFYVDEPTDVHVLLHQTKSFTSPKTGGDAMAQDYMGMYLYDDTDRKIAGVHAATNFRETSIIHRLPRSGRYALSITCPRGKGTVPADVTIVSSFGSHIRRVEAPEDAAMLPDEAENVEDSEGDHTRAARIDYNPFEQQPSDVREQPDSSVPFEDRRFMLDNRDVTTEPWVHIGDLYPEGKTKPLLPSELSRDQFEQGDTFECCCLTGFATLIESHPDVIRQCFISKNPRKDGRYTFQFHRYGQWIKVEIDDRIPTVKGNTVFCRSPTHHWWPLLLEKAYAKFYTLYENLVGCSLAELYHDFSGCPVINVPVEGPAAVPGEPDVSTPAYWVKLRDELRTTAVAAQCDDGAEGLGLASQQFYGVLDILTTTAQPRALSEVVVQLHNPFLQMTYSGPLSDAADPRWASREMRHYTRTQNTIFIPGDVFVRAFSTVSQAHLGGLVEPCWNFHSEWGDGTNGGNPSLLTWRENPLYVVRNTSSAEVEVMAMIRQPDKRHLFHQLPDLDYVRCDILLAQSTENDQIPTYLVTHNSHRIAHKNSFLNFREVASKVRVPPHSLCYLVPTALHHEKSIFLLSYWYRTPADERVVSVARLHVDVARDLPAVKHVVMVPEQKDRVDFIVDVPTDAHILLSQWNRDTHGGGGGGGDVRTQNYVGMYLYDDANRLVAGVASASNLKEIGLVTHLPAQGHYVLSITCPSAVDREVNCRVEVVCVEAARVRITDAYESAPVYAEIEDAPAGAEDVLGEDEDVVRPAEATKAKRPPVPASQSRAGASQAPPVEAEESEAPPSLSFLRPQYLGIPTTDLPLMENPALMALAQERAHLQKHPSQNAARVNSLEGAMDAMAMKMAEDMHRRERAALNPQPEGVPLDLLPLNEDEVFTGLEHELRVAAKDPSRTPADVAALQERVQERANEMARGLKDEERDLFLDPMPLGVPCGDLPLDADPQFHALEVARLRERRKEPQDEAKVRQLNDALNKRAEELARAVLAAERDYLKPEHLHVATQELPLDEDRDFAVKEALRHEMLKDPRSNTKAIAALEDELNDAAEAIAAELLEKQRPGYLAPEYHGRRTADLPLNESDPFLVAERRRRDLLAQPQPDAAAIDRVESDLNRMAGDIAKAVNVAERPQYMKPSYRGKAPSELPLDSDPAIMALEAHRARLRHDPVRNAAAIREAEDAIHDRADALAKELVDAERAQFYGKPGGVPVVLLDLDSDPVIRRLEAERRDLLKSPATNARAIAATEERLHARAAELAEEFKDNMRSEIAGDGRRSPSAMSIGSDAPCHDMEEKLYALMSEDPTANQEQILDLKDAIRKRHHELQRQAKQALRAFLEQDPFGIPLEDLDLDHDAAFVDTEAALKSAMAANMPPVHIDDLQNAMQLRVNELAAAELARRYPFLDPHPADVPLAELPVIGHDEPFWQAIAALEAAEADPRSTPSAVQARKDAVNQRLLEIADAKKWAERDAFLDARPADVPVRTIPLDSDPQFVALETQRRRSLNSGAEMNPTEIRTIEDALNLRAHELATTKKWADRNKVLDPKPEGVPLRFVPLDEDPEFAALEDEWRGLMQDPKRNAKPLKDLEKQMNDRAHELASAKKWADRDRILDPKPEGVPLRDVPLDEDAAFTAMEDQWRELAQDPQRNAKALKDLEKQMNNRAHELAKATKEAERDKYVPRRPSGVDRGDIGLDGDAAFTAMEEERRGLVAQDPRANARRIQDLESQLGARAGVLASAKKWADRDKVLDPKPEGVPLRFVPLDEDPEFAALEDEWRGLMQDPKRNAKPLKDLEKQMNDRAHELASAKKWADRDRILDPKPEGVPLRDVPLDEDAAFTAMEDQWRVLMEDPQRNAKAIVVAEEQMNARVFNLAALVAEEDEGLDGYESYLPRGDEETDDRDVRREAPVRAAYPDLRQRWEAVESYKRRLGSDVAGVPVDLLHLDDDSYFRTRDIEYRERETDSPVDRSRILALEEEMRERAFALAKKFKADSRTAILGEEVMERVEERADLDADEVFVAVERERYHLEASDARVNASRMEALERTMRRRAAELARPPVRSEYRGIPVEKLNEYSHGELFKKHTGAPRKGREPKEETAQVDPVMDGRARDIADTMVADESYPFLGKEVGGVPIEALEFREDELFAGLAEKRRRAGYHEEDYSSRYQDEVEEAMQHRVEELADKFKQVKAASPSPANGAPKKKPTKPPAAPKEAGSAARRRRDRKTVREVEERTEERRVETVEEADAFTDGPFHSANVQVAEAWPRIADVYPEGATQPLLPDVPRTSDMASPAGDLTYLAPFLAALSRQPPLLQRLFHTKTHPVRAPYSFVFFDPSSAPVTVDVDDRIPCDEHGEPRFTVSPNGAWWPLLLEKAYAKYVGGYDRFDECTSHETLRDLTGRPVTHLPLEPKLAAEVAGCNYRDLAFWRRVHDQLEHGDVFMAVSNETVPDGIHPHCYYAVFGVIETVLGSSDPSDVVVKLHNCYHDAPEYRGPLSAHDPDWTPTLRSVCKADPEAEPEFLYLPQPVFLRNFSSMQRCHINCGDRLTVAGEWVDGCCGGNPKYTTFRENQMYLVQNNSNRNVTVLAELRHSAPVYYDAHDVGVYHPTALALLRPDSSAQLVAPLLAYNTHKFVQKGLLTDAREVCAEMELPANSTCYLIPYTKKKACVGAYQLSVYPQDHPVNLTTLRPIAETHTRMSKDVVVQPGSGASARVDITVSEPCDVHVLLHQNKITDPSTTKRGDHLAEDEIFMAAYENNAVLVCSTGDASNAREHALAFQAARAGRYTFLIGCPSKPVSGDAPCTLTIYTPPSAQAHFAAVAEPPRTKVPPRVQSANGATASSSTRAVARKPHAPQRPSSTSNGGAAHTPRSDPRSRGYSQ